MGANNIPGKRFNGKKIAAGLHSSSLKAKPLASSLSLSEKRTASLPVSRPSIGVQVTEIGKEIEKEIRTHRRELHEAVGKLYGIAKILSRNSVRWNAFRADTALWKNMKRPSQNADILRTVIKLAVKDNKQASLYYRAVKGFFDGDLSSDEVPAAILRGGGFHVLASKNAKKRRPGPNGGGSGSAPPARLTFKSSKIPAERLRQLPDECDLHLRAKLRKGKDGRCELIILNANLLNAVEEAASVSKSSPPQDERVKPPTGLVRVHQLHVPQSSRPDEASPPMFAIARQLHERDRSK